jgi:hypothetical protein
LKIFSYLSAEFIEPLLQDLEIHQAQASEQGRDTSVGVIGYSNNALSQRRKTYREITPSANVLRI